jgi:peptidoglycan hydrolase-like protein with peptidoglycan-binding domain
MKRTLIALFATAALAIPAVAQQQDPNQNADQNTSQDQNTGQDQNAGQNTPDPAMDKQGGGSISLTRAQTRMLQQALNSGGLDAGPVDGIMGEKTKQALQKYQSQKGLNASGQVDRETMAALLSERGRQTASRKGQGMSSQPHDQGQQGNRQ